MSGPNLLYIHSDQHSPFVMGCAGDPVVETPHLDRLASEGVVLDACYCPSPLCVPSRMATLAGRYPSDNRVWTNSHMLASSTPTLAHAMGAGGYRPALVGRMHSVGPDQLHGYVGAWWETTDPITSAVAAPTTATCPVQPDPHG